MRTVLIGGASSDIGLRLCGRYLAEGWSVIAHYRTARSELSALEGPRCALWRMDFADTSALESHLTTHGDVLSRVDAFVNLAAAMPACSFEDADARSIVATFATNVVPGLLIAKALAPSMIARGFGRIVYASSIGVKFGGGSDSFLYSLSKHALEFIPRAAREWTRHGVLTNVVRVGVTDTRGHANFPAKRLEDRVARIPSRRMAAPKEIAEVFFWLGSERNTAISGEIVSAAGGE